MCQRSFRKKWKKSRLENLSDDERENFPELNLQDQEHRKWLRSLMKGMSEGHSKDDEGGHAWQDEPEKPGHGEHGTHNESDKAGHSAHGKYTHATHGQGERSIPDDDVHAHLNHVESESEADFIDTIYPVQVLWDETMADTASKWLNADSERKLVILAGHGHCHDSGIVRRMMRRGVEKVVSVKPVVETGAGEIAKSLADPKNDYLFVMSRH